MDIKKAASLLRKQLAWQPRNKVGGFWHFRGGFQKIPPKLPPPIAFKSGFEFCQENF
mgnify:CR=1 FL=1